MLLRPPVVWRSSGRAPRGARGLKYDIARHNSDGFASCPSRGTWIEMPDPDQESGHPESRAPRGARGLKWVGDQLLNGHDRRAPRGARGLKYLRFDCDRGCGWSCPSRGTWIEIMSCPAAFKLAARRAPRGARGLKYLTAESFQRVVDVVPLAGHVD